MKLYWADEKGVSGQQHYLLKRQTPTLRPFLTRHNHDYAEIIYIEKGSMLHLWDEGSRQASKGSIIFIPPERSYHCMKEYSENLSILQILFPKSTFDFIGRRYDIPIWDNIWFTGTPRPHLFSPVQQQWFEKTFNHLLLTRDSLFEIERYLLNLFGLIADSDKGEERRYSETWIEKALQEIQEPAHFRKGVQGFAALCGRTAEHVDRELKKLTNQTITDVVNQARMAWASYMLIFSEEEIINIAQGCGFNSLSYFYKLFRDFYDTTPSNYRKELGNHSESSLNGGYLPYIYH